MLKPFARAVLCLTMSWIAVGACLLCSPRIAAADGLISAASRLDEVYDSARGIVYVTNGSQIVRYQVSTGTYLAPISLTGTLAGIDISPDDNTLAVADETLNLSGYPMIYLIDLPTLAATPVQFPENDNEGGSFSVAFTDSGNVLVSTNYQGSGWVPLRLYNPNIQTTTVVASITQESMLCASADRSSIGVAESNISDGRFGRYRVADGNWQEQTGYTLGTSWFNYEIGVNSTATLYAIPTYGGTFFYDTDLLKTGPTVGVAGGEQPIGVVFSPNSDIVYFPWEGTSTVYAYNTSTYTSVAAYNFGSAFTMNGNRAYDNGRMKISKDGSLLFASVAGGVQFVTVGASTLRLDSLSQSSAPAGNPDVSITVIGNAFDSSALVEWNGNSLPTTVTSSTELEATIPAADLATSEASVVSVTDGANSSNPLRFYVTPAAPIALAAIASTN